jgi:tripartite-type tricarboxylate transporter receptor subunit TctC
VKNQIGTFYSILDTQWVSRVTDVKANTIISNLVPELVLFGLISLNVQADPYPIKPIKLVVPYTPGGGTDILARMLGRDLSKALGVSVLIPYRWSC